MNLKSMVLIGSVNLNGLDEIQKLINTYIARIDELTKSKDAGSPAYDTPRGLGPRATKEAAFDEGGLFCFNNH